ncbi:bifunctional NAD(P)H-hydrate repair enzyme [Virgisporangium aliadipatigenens]|uniref:Bifunctional NAD(P)H-hydrate repair enzyme n=1 Tax=Virgisporangium aliadipatigenens TaxID=741659 RepID=A0A8J4DNR9_9ACTN|nr:NAD(P)H-hydrate dehydratase [Virgisporangium aliadipatigenens]GIJ44724.1 bifunctional NAD(P)H-hydrate repair enzyme [Virgisporangium aliadipatigenens]
MKGAWRVSDIRSAEAALMATLPPGTLMKRAAAGLTKRVVSLLTDRFGGVYGRRVLLLVGAGDNGGDTLLAGAALARRGAAVSALRLADRVHEEGWALLLAAGGRSVAAVPRTVDVVLDGIVGIGAKGGLRANAAAAVKSVRQARAGDRARPAVVAVDVPSGVSVDTGAVEGDAVRADVTVTFGAYKPALLVGPAAVHAGIVELVDIGLRPYLTGTAALRVPERVDVAAWWPRTGPQDDKYRRGVVGLATGSADYPGAAVLGVAGALAGPTGYVRYAGSAAQAIRDRFPTVVCAERVGDAGRVQAWVCGSGLGTDGRAQAELRAVLAAPVPVCLDADALNLLVDGSLAGQLRDRRAPTVVTPHDREFARLAGADPGPDRVESALQLAARMNAVVLLKGDRTVVATPGGFAYANPTGSAALATAGTGDVLAGLLGSLLAAGLAAELAAMAAAYVHGLAGRRAAADGPPNALHVAEALRETLSNVIIKS